MINWTFGTVDSSINDRVFVFSRYIFDNSNVFGYINFTVVSKPGGASKCNDITGLPHP